MPTTFPPIGQAQPELNAIFAGLARGQDNQPDYGLILNTARPSGELTWEAAKAWAASLGEGWRLPTRNESALLYAFLRDQFEPDWYWTSEAEGSAYAWAATSTTATRTTTTGAPKAAPWPSAASTLNPSILRRRAADMVKHAPRAKVSPFFVTPATRALLALRAAQMRSRLAERRASREQLQREWGAR
jgi:hypothetical protein